MPGEGPLLTGYGRAAVEHDFNGDGRMDIAVVTSQNSRVSILLGKGNGSFETPVTVPGSSGGDSIVKGDFNHDGKIDLAVNAFSEFAIYLGNGTGGFLAPTWQSWNSPVNGAAGLVYADFNRDSRPDFASVSPDDNQVWMRLGTATGGYGAVLKLNTGALPVSITTLDANNDGAVDFVVTYYQSSVAGLYLNNGSATFTASTSIDFGAAPLAMLARDVDADGKVDVVAAKANGIAIAKGTGGGSFTPPSSITDSPATSLLARDIDSDGDLDLISANKTDETVRVFRQYTSGTFASSDRIIAGSGPVIAAASDFDGNGRTDLLCFNWNSKAVTVLPATRDSTFRGATVIPTSNGVSAIASGDFNGDQRPDVVTTNWNTNSVSVSLQAADGAFAAGQSLAVGTHPGDIVTSDFDLDGKLDFAVANLDSFTVSIRLGNGDGTFRSVPGVSLGSQRTPGRIVVGNFNGDNLPDLATANSLGNSVSILLNAGSGAFTYWNELGLVQSPQSLAVADFDRNGLSDLAIGFIQFDSLQVLRCLPGAIFSSPTTLPGVRRPRDLAAADLNNDGLIDLVAPNEGDFTTPPTASIFLATATSFATAQTLALSSKATSVVAADVNANGICDLVFNGDAATIAVALGNGTGGFDVSSHTATPQSASDLATADFNGDGRLDLAACFFSSGLTYVLQNVGLQAPSLQSASFNIDTLQVSFQFDLPLNPLSIAPTDLLATNLAIGTTRAANSALLSADGKSITFSFSGPPFTDGPYRFRIPMGTIESSSGGLTRSDTDLTGTNYYILAGDLNRDRVVNFDDLLTLSQNFGQTGKTFSQGNIDYSPDGLVGFDDLLILAQRYGTSVLEVKSPQRKARTSAEAVFESGVED